MKKCDIVKNSDLSYASMSPLFLNFTNGGLNMKRTAALLLLIILCFTLTFPAYAENPTANPDCGIIDAAELDALIEEYAESRHVATDLFGIGFIYTATGDSYYYNGDSWYYSGSLYKLPNCMMISEKVVAGEIDFDTVITNQYGSYPVSTLLEYSITYSNNDTGHTVVEYLGGTYSGKNAEKFIEYTSLDESYFTNPDFFDVSYYSPRFVCEVLNTLYTETERFPNIIPCMLNAQPGAYFKRDIQEYEVAQKYGAYVDNNGRNWNNTCGIIYTPTPILVAVLTKNAGNYEEFIGGAAKLLADYSLKLDEKLPAYLEALAAEPEPTEEPAETENPDGTGETAEPSPIPATPSPEPSKEKSGGNSAVTIILIIAALAVAVAAVLVVASRNKKARRAAAKARAKKAASPVYEDDYDDEVGEDDVAPVHRQSEKVQNDVRTRREDAYEKHGSGKVAHSARSSARSSEYRGRHESH